MKKLEYCMKTTSDCLKKAKVKTEQGKELMKWANNYYNDAVHYSKSDPETALEAVSYAHGFIDSGVLLGHLEIEGYHISERL
jgi:hypothetical protein